MSGKVGIDCRAYRNTGTYGTPTWNEITIARDVTLGLDKDEAEASIRGVRWKMRLPTLKDAQITLEILHDPSVDDYNVLRDAYLNDTVLDIALADGVIATTGTQYFRSDQYVFGFTRKEPLTDALTVEIPLKLAYSVNAPVFVTVP